MSNVHVMWPLLCITITSLFCVISVASISNVHKLHVPVNPNVPTESGVVIVFTWIKSVGDTVTTFVVVPIFNLETRSNVSPIVESTIIVVVVSSLSLLNAVFNVPIACGVITKVKASMVLGNTTEVPVPIFILSVGSNSIPISDLTFIAAYWPLTNAVIKVPDIIGVVTVVTVVATTVLIEVDDSPGMPSKINKGSSTLKTCPKIEVTMTSFVSVVAWSSPFITLFVAVFILLKGTAVAVSPVPIIISILLTKVTGGYCFLTWTTTIAPSFVAERTFAADTPVTPIRNVKEPSATKTTPAAASMTTVCMFDPVSATFKVPVYVTPPTIWVTTTPTSCVIAWPLILNVHWLNADWSVPVVDPWVTWTSAFFTLTSERFGQSIWIPPTIRWLVSLTGSFLSTKTTPKAASTTIVFTPVPVSATFNIPVLVTPPTVWVTTTPASLTIFWEFVTWIFASLMLVDMPWRTTSNWSGYTAAVVEV